MCIIIPLLHCSLNIAINCLVLVDYRYQDVYIHQITMTFTGTPVSPARVQATTFLFLLLLYFISECESKALFQVFNILLTLV